MRIAMFDWRENAARKGNAMSAGSIPAVASWYNSGWNVWKLFASMRVTWKSVDANSCAAARPANPAPTMTT